MINIKELKPEDKGRKVVYYSDRTRKPEEGIITSWNDLYIFVDYNNEGRGIATSPNTLDWIIN